MARAVLLAACVRLTLLTLLLARTAVAGTWYVSPAGSDGNSGTSWAEAFASPNKAAGVVLAGDTVTLASGTYLLVGTVAMSVDRVSWLAGTRAVWSCNGGEYAGVSVTAAEVSVANITFLACGPGMEVTVASASVTCTDCLFLENSVTIVNSGCGGGLYISDGSVTFLGATLFDSNLASGATPNGGGGLWMGGGSVIFNSTATFTSNNAQYGGAVEQAAGTLSFLSTVSFTGNSASSEGGALRQYGGALEFDSTTAFTSNSAPYGGAVFLDAGKLAFRSSVIFENNSASAYGGSVCQGGGVLTAFAAAVFTSNSAGDGGALYMDAGNSGALTFYSTAFFANNSAPKSSGGAVHLISGTLRFNSPAFLTSNSARFGGAIFSPTGSTGTMTFNSVATLTNNSVAVNGGAMDLDGGTVTFNSTAAFINNSASFNAGAVRQGGAILTFNDAVTFVGNSAASAGGGVMQKGGALVFNSNATFSNNNASSGGAVATFSGILMAFVGSSSFLGNMASQGGALFLDGTTAAVVFNASTVFADNHAFVAGGGDAVYVASGSVQFNGNVSLDDSAWWASGEVCVVASGVVAFSDEQCSLTLSPNYPAVTGVGNAGCPRGLFGAQNSSSIACLPCANGFTSTVGNVGEFTCAACPPGTISASSGLVTCGLCPAGSSSLGGNASSCYICSAGTFSKSGASTCTACPAGSFSFANSSSCTPCPAGTFSAFNGSAVCLVCPSTSGSRQTGLSSCPICPLAIAWTELAPSAPWVTRQLFSSLSLPNGSVLLMVGYHTASLSDVWESTDGGSTWTELAAISSWPPRFLLSSLSLGTGDVVVLGGENGGYFNDVWRSADAGVSWSQTAANIPWKARSGAGVVLLSTGDLLLMGGYNGSCLNDVWRSNDDGSSWLNIEPHAPWSSRCGFGAASLSIMGDVLVMGGTDGVRQLNDVWASHDGGLSWTALTTNASWSPRRFFSTVALPYGSLLVMGGSDNDGNYLSDVWQSVDGGVTWTQLTSVAPWPPRYGFGSALLPNGDILVMGGAGNGGIMNDVWRGRVSCLQCQPGYFLSSALLVCQQCPAGSVASAIGSSSCIACPVGWFAAPGSSSCSSCPSGYTTVGGPGAQLSDCQPAPASGFAGGLAPASSAAGASGMAGAAASGSPTGFGRVAALAAKMILVSWIDVPYLSWYFDFVKGFSFLSLQFGQPAVLGISTESADYSSARNVEIYAEITASTCSSWTDMLLFWDATLWPILCLVLLAAIRLFWNEHGDATALSKIVASSSIALLLSMPGLGVFVLLGSRAVVWTSTCGSAAASWVDVPGLLLPGMWTVWLWLLWRWIRSNGFRGFLGMAAFLGWKSPTRGFWWILSSVWLRVMEGLLVILLAGRPAAQVSLLLVSHVVELTLFWCQHPVVDTLEHLMTIANFLSDILQLFMVCSIVSTGTTSRPVSEGDPVWRTASAIATLQTATFFLNLLPLLIRLVLYVYRTRSARKAAQDRGFQRPSESIAWKPTKQPEYSKLMQASPRTPSSSAVAGSPTPMEQNLGNPLSVPRALSVLRAGMPAAVQLGSLVLKARLVVLHSLSCCPSAARAEFEQRLSILQTFATRPMEVIRLLDDIEPFVPSSRFREWNTVHLQLAMAALPAAHGTSEARMLLQILENAVGMSAAAALAAPSPASASFSNASGTTSLLGSPSVVAGRPGANPLPPPIVPRRSFPD